jgi:hypothetical protein
MGKKALGEEGGDGLQQRPESEHRARQAAPVRAGFHKVAAMSRQLERAGSCHDIRGASMKGSAGS